MLEVDAAVEERDPDAAAVESRDAGLRPASRPARNCGPRERLRGDRGRVDGAHRVDARRRRPSGSSSAWARASSTAEKPFSVRVKERSRRTSRPRSREARDQEPLRRVGLGDPALLLLGRGPASPLRAMRSAREGARARRSSAARSTAAGRVAEDAVPGRRGRPGGRLARAAHRARRPRQRAASRGDGREQAPRASRDATATPPSANASRPR